MKRNARDMNKRTILLFAVLACLCVFVACGGGTKLPDGNGEGTFANRTEAEHAGENTLEDPETSSENNHESQTNFFEDNKQSNNASQPHAGSQIDLPLVAF